MPKYDYHCRACGQEFEVSQRISEPKLERCVHCDQPTVDRKIGAPAFVLKGGGWYADGYASRSSSSNTNHNGTAS